MKTAAVIHYLLAIALAPLLPGLINRVKAFFAGRYGPPIAQAYYDLWKLFQKRPVYSRTTTWVFRAGPLVNVACLLILVAYLLGLGRFATIMAALDTGSSFEGMGASREAQFAVFAEPALLIGLAALARTTQSLSLSPIYAGLAATPTGTLTLRILLGAGFFILFLAENCRIPVDDPQTHLELTMIHEVMVLDHGAVDYGFVQWGSCLKLWALGTLWAGLWLPTQAQSVGMNWVVGLGAMLGLVVVTGIVESATARLRLLRVPQLLVGAGVLCALGLMLTFW